MTKSFVTITKMPNKTKTYQAILIASILFNLYIRTIESAKILGIFPVLSKSHHSINQPIVKGLAGRGHEVTILSHFKSKTAIPNYTEILISEACIDWIDSITIEDSINLDGVEKLMKIYHALESPTCEKVLGTEYIRELINSETKSIDLIIVESRHMKCFHLLAHKLKAPLIILVSTSLGIGVDYFIGNPNNPSITPIVVSKFTTKMDFLQRLQNLFHNGMMYWRENFVFNKDLERYAREVFNMELPMNEELNKRTALTFYNNHDSFMARSTSPNVINIAGIHITESKKLPKDVEDFIEGSDQGVIFFSFGTTIKATSISPEKMKIIKEAFSEISQRVLWRVNELNITDVPANVKLGKWFPQRDILEHKNVIGFISHCGLQGTLEAIHMATPIIGMPFAFDQFQNINVLVEKEAGIYVDYFAMDKNTLIDAINEIITNSKYRENMQRLSRVFRDRPMSPLDEALYWSEYVLKHKGAPHLRPESADMPLYQYLLFDVFLFISITFIGILYFCKFVFRLILYQGFRQKLNKIKIQ